MIIPIAVTKGGVTRTVGTAYIEPVGDDFSVEFYLLPGASLSDQAKTDIEKQLKLFARKKDSEGIFDLRKRDSEERGSHEEPVREQPAG